MDAPLIRHPDELDWTEAMPQLQGEERIAIGVKILHSTPDCLASYTRYDPRLVVEPHSHHGREVVHVLDGGFALDGRICGPGTTIVLEAGTPFGPVVVGERGACLLEVFIGTDAWELTPIAGDVAWAELVRERDLRLLPGAGRAETT